MVQSLGLDWTAGSRTSWSGSDAADRGFATGAVTRRCRMIEKTTSLLPRDWRELAPLVDRLLDTPADQRSLILAEMTGGDTGRRAALERLLADCERKSSVLDRPVFEVFPELLRDDVGPRFPT